MAQYFNLTLDTTAPSNGVLSGLNTYYNSSASVTIAADGASYMKVWTNQTAVGTASDAEVPSIWEPYNTSKTVSFSAQGANYVHAMFMDEVGNIGVVVNSAEVIYDTVNPVISSIDINNGAGYTNVKEVSVTVSFSDATSGVNTITLNGDIDEAGTSYTLTNEDRTAGTKTFTVNLSGADGTKTVSAIAEDRAGNSSTSVSDSIVLDTSAAEGTLVLRKADDSANLPEFVNYVEYAAAIETEDTDIVGYKIWEGNTEPSEWTTVTQDPQNPRILVENLSLSSGDGVKTIHAKIQDEAGTITELTAVNVTLDTIAPTVTLSGSPTVISAVSGYNEVTFTCGATDVNSAQGLNYELKLGTDVIKSGVLTETVVVTTTEIEAISAGEGNKSFTLEVTDIAENTGVSTAQVITLDKTAPTGSVTAEQYYNSQSITVAVAGSDAGGATMSKMKVWLDNNEPATWEDFTAGNYAMSSISEGAHVAHVKFMDSVGNESTTFNSSEFIVDVTAPTLSISTPAYTGSTSIVVTLTYSDAKGAIAVSDVDQMKVWEDGTTEPEWESVASTKNITLTNGDGTKTLKGKVKDAAGNISEIATTTTVLDTDEPDAVLNLYKTDGTTLLPARVNVTGFVAKLSHTAPDTAPIVEYKLSGDFDQSSDQWQTFTYDAGQTYMTISGLTLTDSDALKTISLQIKDAAGNVSSVVNQTVTLDRVPPVIDVANVDYNIVSKQHTARLNAAGTEISGAYNDMMTFSFSANENLVAWKVCVNETGQTAEGAVAIGTTGGSQNMTGGTVDGHIVAVEANTDVNCTIMGADFAATSAVNDTDGAYEVIVYGQDEGHTWSAIHAMSI